MKFMCIVCLGPYLPARAKAENGNKSKWRGATVNIITNSKTVLALKSPLDCTDEYILTSRLKIFEITGQGREKDKH